MLMKCILVLGFTTLTATEVPAETTHYVTDAYGVLPNIIIQDTPRARWAGLLAHVATGAQEHGLEVVPAGPTQEMLLFVGPKSAVAGKDEVHAVAVGLDSTGNLVADETATSFAINIETRPTTFTRYGIADVLFLPSPQAGLFHAGAFAGNRQTARGEFRVVPDLASISPTLKQSDTPVQRDTFAVLETEALVDQYGNPVGGGVALQVLGKMQDDHYTLGTSITVDDAAKMQLLTRDMGTIGEFRAYLGNGASPPIGFAAETLTAPEPPVVTAWAVPTLGAMDVRVGPFLSSAGHMLNDGTAVTISALLQDGEAVAINGWLRDGFLDVLLLGEGSSLPAEFVIRSQTGEFKQRLERLESGPKPSDREME